MHSNATVEYDVDEGSKSAILLDEALHAHVLERRLFSDDKSNLSELGGEKKAIGMAESVLGSTNIDVGEEGKSFDMAILVHRVVGHVHIPLANGLTLDTTEMDGFLLRVVLDDLDDGESVDGEKMSVGTFPNGTGSRRTVVQIHTHTRLLRTLASEDIDGGGLRSFSRASENLFAAAVGRLDANYNVTVAHAHVAELDFEVVAWDDHTNKVDIITIKGC